MTPEVKERLALIRQGEVPKGYQETKAGIAPKAWKAVPLSKLVSFKNGINADKERFGSGIKMISVRDILDEHPILYDTIVGSVEVTEKQQADFSVSYGDILFQRSSENYEDAGTSNVYLDTEREAVFSGFVIRGKKKEKYDPIYLNGLLKTFTVRKEIIRNAAGAQHVNVGQDSLSKIIVTLPDIDEQQRIADILTTQDKLIELKEKLLEEKKWQKKYLMQQLLTGKKRLLGFVEKWNKIDLAKISKK